MATLAMLETQTTAFLSELNSCSAAALSRRPSPPGWSALQVLDHLVKTEEGILVLAKLGAENPHRIGIRDRLGFLFIMKVFQTGRKVKIPASAAQVFPDSELDFIELCERWRKTRLDFSEFQSQLSPEQAWSGLFRHPVIGWMGTQQIIDFFCVHIVHHEFQIKRLGLKTPE